MWGYEIAYVSKRRQVGLNHRPLDWQSGALPHDHRTPLASKWQPSHGARITMEAMSATEPGQTEVFLYELSYL